jgi:hypothetical protein
MKLDTHYRKLENELNTFLASLSTLADSEKSEVKHFIDVGEYGLALESLVGALVEKTNMLTPDVQPQVRRLANLMALTDSPIFDYLDSSTRS